MNLILQTRIYQESTTVLAASLIASNFYFYTVSTTENLVYRTALAFLLVLLRYKTMSSPPVTNGVVDEVI